MVASSRFLAAPIFRESQAGRRDADHTGPDLLDRARGVGERINHDGKYDNRCIARDGR